MVDFPRMAYFQPEPIFRFVIYKTSVDFRNQCVEISKGGDDKFVCSKKDERLKDQIQVQVMKSKIKNGVTVTCCLTVVNVLRTIRRLDWRNRLSFIGSLPLIMW